MTKIVTDDRNGKSCEATGHPSDCTEPVSGVVEGSSHSVTINNANGDEKPIATTASTLHFDSHSHDYSVEQGCHDNQSHDISSYTSNVSSSININGNPVLIISSDVATDPGTGDSVNVTGSGINNSLSESP